MTTAVIISHLCKLLPASPSLMLNAKLYKLKNSLSRAYAVRVLCVLFFLHWHEDADLIVLYPCLTLTSWTRHNVSRIRTPPPLDHLGRGKWWSVCAIILIPVISGKVHEGQVCGSYPVFVSQDVKVAQRPMSLNSSGLPWMERLSFPAKKFELAK